MGEKYLGVVSGGSILAPTAFSGTPVTVVTVGGKQPFPPERILHETPVSKPEATHLPVGDTIFIKLYESIAGNRFGSTSIKVDDRIYTVTEEQVVEIIGVISGIKSGSFKPDLRVKS